MLSDGIRRRPGARHARGRTYAPAPPPRPATDSAPVPHTAPREIAHPLPGEPGGWVSGQDTREAARTAKGGKPESTPQKTSVGSNRRAGIAGGIAASFAVFLVALPLCVGVTVASGAPLELGIVSGVIGWLVVSAARSSTLRADTGPKDSESSASEVPPPTAQWFYPDPEPRGEVRTSAPPR